MQRVRRDQLTYVFAPDVAPVLTISSGETVVFETYDTSTGRVRHVDDLPHYLAVRDPNKVNPAAGPIRVEGAEPGDGLAVTIQSIRLQGPGFVRLHPKAGLAADYGFPPGILMADIEGDAAVLRTSAGVVSLPVRPHVGVIGTLPAEGRWTTAVPGPIGSNLDVNLIKAGATVYLPVHVPGAGLALGDVHASMGDGELSGTGIEISAEVAVRVELVKGARWGRPWLECEGRWVTVATAPDLQACVDQAAADMAALLVRELGVTPTEAVLLISAAGDVHVGQAASLPGVNPTAYIAFPQLPRPQ